MANKCFATNKECSQAGDYILRKKRLFSCKPKCFMKPDCVVIPKCRVNNNNTANEDSLPYKYNLNMNLFTKLDLNDVKVIEDSLFPHSKTITATNFYKRYIIDPNGDLFGNTPCGYNNYLLFLKNKKTLK